MKWIIIPSLIFFSSAFGQTGKKDIEDPNGLKIKEINLEARAIAPSEIKLPFNSIKIIDSRFDTSKIGFENRVFTSKSNAFKSIQFAGGLAAALEKYYADYYENAFDSSGFTLLIVIKKFWISHHDYQSNKQPFMQSNSNVDSRIRCKWEYYLSKGNKHLPIKRVDTTWTLNEEMHKYLNEEFEEKKQRFIKFSLKALIEMLDYEKAVLAFDTQPAKTLGDIIRFNESRFNLPVLNEGSLAKGVFLNFEEFINNRPGIVSFREKETKHKSGKVNYIENENGVEIVSYWGYCDGKSLKYGRFGNNRLFRVQNTFAFFTKSVSYNYSSSNTTTGYYTTNFTLKNRNEIWIPFQIDMETGDVY